MPMVSAGSRRNTLHHLSCLSTQIQFPPTLFPKQNNYLVQSIINQLLQFQAKRCYCIIRFLHSTLVAQNLPVNSFYTHKKQFKTFIFVLVLQKTSTDHVSSVSKVSQSRKLSQPRKLVSAVQLRNLASDIYVELCRKFCNCTTSGNLTLLFRNHLA